MDSTTVINKINDLDFKGFKEAYIRQLENVNYHSLTFEDRVYNHTSLHKYFIKKAINLRNYFL